MECLARVPNSISSELWAEKVDLEGIPSLNPKGNAVSVVVLPSLGVPSCLPADRWNEVDKKTESEPQEERLSVVSPMPPAIFSLLLLLLLVILKLLLLLGVALTSVLPPDEVRRGVRSFMTGVSSLLFKSLGSSTELNVRDLPILCSARSPRGLVMLCGFDKLVMLPDG